MQGDASSARGYLLALGAHVGVQVEQQRVRRHRPRVPRLGLVPADVDGVQRRDVEEEAVLAAGCGRIVALHHRSFTSYQIH